MNENIIKILKELLSYKTYKDNKEEFNKLFNYIKKNVNKDLFIKEYEFNNNKCLVISNIDSYSFDYIICCHIDVVSSLDYSIKEDKDNLYGRGTFDMKGQVSVFIELLNNLNSNNKIALFITSDEEVDGNCCKELLKIYDSSYAIVPDGGKDFNVISEEKGQLQIELSIKTKSSHASKPYEGINAITELMNVYYKLIKKYPLPLNDLDYKTSVCLSKINGGDSNNSVCSNCSMVLDIRHVYEDSKEDILNYIMSLNKNILIKVLVSGSVFVTDVDSKLIKDYLKICKNITSKDVSIIKCSSTSDAIYFSDKGITTLLFNPVGDYQHSPLEFVNKKSLFDMYKIFKVILEGDVNE